LKDIVLSNVGGSLDRVLLQNPGVSPSEFWAEMLSNSVVQTGDGPLTSARSTGTNVLDNTGIYRAVSAYKPSPYGARFISADIWSKYDIGGTLLSTAKGFVCAPQRTNLALYSQEFDNAEWNKGGGIAVSPNQTTSPDGTVTADKLYATQAAVSYRFVRQPKDLTIGDRYCGYMFVKKSNYRYVGLRVFSNSTGNDHLVFDFDTETFVFIPATEIFDYGFESLASGWYKIWASIEIDATELRYFGIAFCDSIGNEDVALVGDEEVYIWQGQYELGNAPTAPIVTTGSAVTRTADTHTIPISNFRDEMTITFKWTPHFNYDDLPASFVAGGIVTPTTNQAGSIVRISTYLGTGYISINDGTNEKSKVLNWTKDTTYNVAVSFSKPRGLQGICVAGTDSGDGTHAGFTIADVITFGLSANEEFTISDVQFKPGWSNAAARAILAPA